MSITALHHLERLAEKALKGARVQRIPNMDGFGTYPCVGIIVAGIIVFAERRFHVSSWRHVLKKIGFWPRTVRECDEKLRDERFLTAPEQGNAWVVLSSLGIKIFGLVASEIPGEVKKEVLAFYDSWEKEREKDREAFSRDVPWDILKRNVQARGTDLLVYISKGDYQRPLWGAKRLSELRGRSYGYILAACPPEKYEPHSALKKLKNLSRDISRMGVKEFPGEWWAMELEEILDVIASPREHLDIITPGFPRQALYKLDTALRVHKPYTYSMYYIKALNYPNKNASLGGSTLSLTSSQLVKWKGTKRIVAFAETTADRLELSSLEDEVLNGAEVHLFLPETSFINSALQSEFSLNRRVCLATQKRMKKLGIKFKKSYVDYGCPDAIYQKLLFLQPDAIYVGGSRSVIIALSRYCNEGICWQEPFSPPPLIFTHMNAEVYSDGVIPKVFPLTKLNYLQISDHKEIA